MPLRSNYRWLTLAVIICRMSRSLGSENISDEEFFVGVGIADVTGPATEIGMVSSQSVYGEL